MPGRTVDESFLALPLSALTDAALTRAVDLGCEHADIRGERIRTQSISLRAARLESLADGEDLGLAVRVVHEGTWGFAAGVVLTAAAAVRMGLGAPVRRWLGVVWRTGLDPGAVGGEDQGAVGPGRALRPGRGPLE